VGLTSSPIRLIVNADDFGISRAVNVGIIEAAEAGIVTSASMMVNLPAFADAVILARSGPPISLGLHLTLTSGRPLSGVPSLVRKGTGEFYSLPTFIARASMGLVDESDIVRECTAQIDRMTEAGFHPTHLDSHRHIHIHPAIFPAVRKAVASRRIRRLRIPCEPLLVHAHDWRATLKKTGILFCTHLGRESAKYDRARFYGISIQGRKVFGARLFALIPKLAPGTSELMVHPGHADVSLRELDSYVLDRETELAVLCSRQFRELLDRWSVKLGSFSDQESSVTPNRELDQHHQPEQREWNSKTDFSR
jgi:predicted glycoside hydrolase/deacetylase ChbG (UPF0249 family)